jgi:DEAD/DEAH box helicase domain-containing protein
MTDSALLSLIDQLEYSPEFGENIPYVSVTPAKGAKFQPFPDNLEPALIEALKRHGINRLYSHQAQAIESIERRNNIVISTGTASGKSLCYQIPILDTQLKTSAGKALLLFPTKALANDQLSALSGMCNALAEIEPAAHIPLPGVYDGDTPTHLRSSIRENATILLTNPDMLHLGILPHHTGWEKLISGLRFVVIDEVHMYRGVFGAHVANVLRRLKRICEFYGSTPQFIFTSATIANPKEHAERLVGEPVVLIDQDSSAHGKKYFIFYNPPIINEELGVRQGLITTTIQFSEMILKQQTQALLFSRSRRTVELIIHELRQLFPNKSDIIRGYRSGYLKSDRREIEQGLKSGFIRLAVATNALELGVDIGGVDIVLLAGYPGTISSTRQRAGRAGRKSNTSATLMIASSSPLDQFLCRHPDYVMERNPEMALFDPDNPLILLQHLQCAAFELPFHIGDSFGSLNASTLETFLQVLQAQGVLIQKGDRVLWASQEYPSSNISLRSTATRSISLQIESDEGQQIIGELDYASSLWMAHPGAIYLHEGDPYLVKSLDLEENIATLEAKNLPYYTESVKTQTVNIIQDLNHDVLPGYDIHFSEVEVSTQVTGFKKIDWSTREILSIESLEMPVTVLRTYGFWIAIKPEIVEKMRQIKMWSSDPNDYGPSWEKQRNLARQRDQYRCCLCGLPEGDKPHHVHHKIPFRLFSDARIANELSNLVTLCPNCHHLVELNVKIRSAISGLNYALFHLAPLQVMCDENDLGSYADPLAEFAEKQPVILIYDAIPAGMGLTQSLYEQHLALLNNANDLIAHCECEDGCPSCVGPISETGIGGKKETKALLSLLLKGTCD